MRNDWPSHWHDSSALVIDSIEPGNPSPARASAPEVLDAMQRMMLRDLQGYLPDDILVKVDRAAMAVSLETRMPFLDHRVVEFAWTLPQAYKLRDGQAKWVLRQVLQRHVPRRLIDRPKKGFSVPIDAWLRGPLRDWSEALIDPALLKRQGCFDARTVRQVWDQHLAGRYNWQHQLWSVLMAQAWLGSAGAAAVEASS